MAKHRFLGGDMDGVVIDVPDDRRNWRTPVPRPRPSVLAYDEPPTATIPVLDWTIQRWRRDWSLIGDDCEYLTPPAYELAYSQMQVTAELLVFGGWGALGVVGEELVRAMPGTVVAPPLMWCESVDPQTFAVTIRATAPIVR